MVRQRMMLALMLCIFASSGVFAQLSKMKRARVHMENLNYTSAIELYNQILQKNDNPEAKINIAEAYRKVNDSENAEYWYGQVVQLSEAEPVHKLYYGQMLQRNGKCDLAKEWYQAYIDLVPEDQRGQYLVQACDYEDELRTKNAGIYEIIHVDFNSNLDDFSPAFFKEGIVFASERDKGTAIVREHKWTGLPFNELYFAKRKKDGKEEGIYTYDRPTKYSKKLNSKFHDASVTFSSDQSKIYFTRNNIMNGKTGKDDDGIVRLKVFSATIDGDEWKDLEGLPFNSDEYSVAHPALTPTGDRMYFSSDMPGGFGGMDLYVSTLEGSSWGPPINLGARINTEGNEIFPYYDQSGKLYFSSDGQVGIGGLDIYYMDDLDNGEFGDVINVGYPINTISDDFGIIFNEKGTEGYFSSDREGGAGRDDIYSFVKSAAVIEVLVIDEKTLEPIKGASVVNDCNGNTMMTNSEGKIIIDMKRGQCCNFTASMEEYLDNEKEGCTTDVELGGKVFVEIPLRKENVYNIEGVVVDPNSGDYLEGAMVTLVSNVDGEEIEPVMTDATGSFTFEIQEGSCYDIKATLEGYIGSPIKGQCTDMLKELDPPSNTLQVVMNLSPISTEVAETQNPLVESEILRDENGDIVYDENGDVVYNQPGEVDEFNGEGEGTKTPWEYDPDTETYLDVVTGENYTGIANGKKIVDGREDTKVPSSTGFDESPTKYAGVEGSTIEGNIAYLLHIYYDFDQSYVRDEAQPEIEKLCSLMKDNPNIIVEIASHTDARGSFRYNRSLSQRRAESVVRALIDCGIEEDRLVPRGYGEAKNVNNCANNIPCSEREHQMNRRTEFRIIGCTNCADSVSRSQENKNAEVDECQGCPF